MVVCKFFQSGNCRYGANCRYEHPQTAVGQNSNQNRFAPLSGQSNRTSDGRREQPWAISITDIKNDMTLGQGRPQWILSTYGPGRMPPASLLEGNEYSFEELRLRFYELASGGNEAQANQEAGSLWSKAEEGMRSIAQNADDVIQFMEEAEKRHPNRYDFCKTDGTKTREEIAKSAESSTVFGGGFGQPSATSLDKPVFGQSAGATVFGQSSFGQPPRPAQSANPFAQASAASAFGKPAFGQPAAGTGFGQTSFGQPSQPTSFGTPAFGQPSQPVTGFGQPSQPAVGFGQPSQSSTTFGQFSQPAQSANPFAKPTSAFGQPSQPVSGFGQPSQPASVFGQPSQPAAAFGKPAAPTGFGQSGFGQPSQPTQSANPFAQAVPPNPSQSSRSTTSGFGVGTGFGQTSPTDSPFSQAAPKVPTSSFGQPPTQPASVNLATMAEAKSALTPNVLTGQPTAPLHYTETIPKRAASFRPGTKEVASYSGYHVEYINDAPCYQRPDGKGLERIWFPEFGNGAEVIALNAPAKKDDLEGKSAEYTDEVKQAYTQLFTKGGFGDSGVPVVPPQREWCAFDF